MKNKKGIIYFIIGFLFLAGAGVLYLRNVEESNEAGKMSESALVQMIDTITTEETIEEEIIVDDVSDDNTMPGITIDGNYYIGYLTMDTLGLQLPVISEWSYDNLAIAPCRQMGSVNSNDFVIAAHNYQTHFANIYLLNTGNVVSFTDVNNNVYNYVVRVIETVEPSADVMFTGNDALVLYTCNYTGQQRIVVRCDRA